LAAVDTRRRPVCHAITKNDRIDLEDDLDAVPLRLVFDKLIRLSATSQTTFRPGRNSVIFWVLR
jgi:hypothetical protein